MGVLVPATRLRTETQGRLPSTPSPALIIDKNYYDRYMSKDFDDLVEEAGLDDWEP